MHLGDLSAPGMRQLRCAMALLLALCTACGDDPVMPPPLSPPRPAGRIGPTVAMPFRPFGITGSGNDLYVTQLDGGTLAALSVQPFGAVARATVGSTPTDVAVAGDVIAVTNQASGLPPLFNGSLSLLSRATGTLRAEVQMPGTPFRVALTADGARAYVTTAQGSVLILDVATMRTLLTARFDAPVNGLALHPVLPLLFVSVQDGSVLELSSADLTVRRRLVSGGGRVQDVIFDRARDRLYIASETSGVAAIDLATGTGRWRADEPGAFGLALTRDGAELYVTQPSRNRLAILDAATGATRETLAIGPVPRRIVFSPGGGQAFVTAELSGIIRID